MIRPLIVAASVLASMPAYAVEVPPNCYAAGVIMEAAASNPNAPQRLTGDAYEAILGAINEAPPATQYDGPLWAKRMGKSVLIGGVPPDLPGHVCFAIIPEGPDADRIIALMQPT